MKCGASPEIFPKRRVQLSAEEHERGRMKFNRSAPLQQQQGQPTHSGSKVFYRRTKKMVCIQTFGFK